MALGGGGSSSPPPPSGPAADQNSPPATMAPVASACGNSQYYNGNNAPGASIIGGVGAQQHEYPWLVLLKIRTLSNTVEVCGGTIVASQYVLTSATCVSNVNGFNNVSIYFGEYDLNDGSETNEYTRQSSYIYFHPAMNLASKQYDFAIIKIDTALDLTANWAVQAICLPICTGSSCGSGNVGYISGWGVTDICLFLFSFNIS